MVYQAFCGCASRGVRSYARVQSKPLKALTPMIAAKPKAATDADRTIGSRIAALRAAQGLSQTALGHALGVSFQQVQKYEKGRNRIGAGRLQIIADLLKVPVGTFFAAEAASDGNTTVATLFSDPQVLDLVVAFTDISDATVRANLLSIVKAAGALQIQRQDDSAAMGPDLRVGA